MVAYKALFIGLPKSCTDIPFGKDRVMICFEACRGMSIPMWEASAIYAAISGTEAAVPIERALA